MKTLTVKNSKDRWLGRNDFLTSPFALLDEMLDEEFFIPARWFRGNYVGNVPAVNISETDGEYLVEMSAPGFNKTDFRIELKNGNLVISGEKKEETVKEDKKISRREFHYGAFTRSFALNDDIKEEDISASYENGILKITLPKKEAAKPSVREIRIN